MGRSLIRRFRHQHGDGRADPGRVGAALPQTHRADAGRDARRRRRSACRSGVAAALHRNRAIDIAARLLSLVGLSFPVFVSGVFLLLAFAVHWRMFPGDRRRCIRPIRSAGCTSWCCRRSTLGLVMAAYIIRVTRSAMLQVLGEDYIRTARAKGVPRRARGLAARAAQRGDAGGDGGRLVCRHAARQFGADGDRVQPARAWARSSSARSTRATTRCCRG